MEGRSLVVPSGSGIAVECGSKGSYNTIAVYCSLALLSAIYR